MRIALVGGGPAALFIYKRIIESKLENVQVLIFEQTGQLGSGMPYSRKGAGVEHVANVSAEEVPDLHQPALDWIQSLPAGSLARFGLDPGRVDGQTVLPRLLLGQYLADQFSGMIAKGKQRGIITLVHYNTRVVDITPGADGSLTVQTTASGSEDNTATGNTVSDASADASTENQGIGKGGAGKAAASHVVDTVVICTGHHWPGKLERSLKGWFDSPYPPSKLAFAVNRPVAIRGSSLTAVDAIKTLALANGRFTVETGDSLRYEPGPDSPAFRIVLHSTEGLLPSVRFHYQQAQADPGSLLDAGQIAALKETSGGFVPLDYLFETGFKQPLARKDPALYRTVRDMNLEQFCDHVLSFRRNLDPFTLLEAEYAQAEKSIARKQSIYWKELVYSLNYAVNYPAKHLCAEDMLRLRQTLMPLVGIIIASLPQSSARVLLALHRAGALQIQPVGPDSHPEPDPSGGVTYHYTDQSGRKVSQSYGLFIDCVGQRPYPYERIPFDGLKKAGLISPARIRFKHAAAADRAATQSHPVEGDTAGNPYLRLPGVSINDSFQVLDGYGAACAKLYVMAVPMIAGMNPDFSGLDFCQAASLRVIESIEQLS